MIMTQNNVSEKSMSIIARQTTKKKHHCILCASNETHQGKNYYDIEIHTTRKMQAQAIVLSLASMTEGFEGDYNRLTQIHVNLCELHYRNLSENLPLNQEKLADFDEFKTLFVVKKKKAE